MTRLAAVEESDDVESRQEVILALAAIGHDAASATPQLLTILKSDGEPLRAAAALALASIGSQEAVPALTQTALVK